MLHEKREHIGLLYPVINLASHFPNNLHCSFHHDIVFILNLLYNNLYRNSDLTHICNSVCKTND